ncbi:nuclear envelope pore membrane protein POM 121C-like isoform X2 [Pecten maximus]|uniref:nuclear envelope pore membrane protein POM 121C-like isoform X2 n=1 Tax=Pecten maximus TaxID=6579 RepID=UPI001457FEC7|nr:nuclear envelope pore membrane protein POM 121C-like isoform X2 [Pecten maximus]
MQLDFKILLVILILSFFIIYILSYFSFITILISTFISVFILIIFGRSIGERCATKLKSPANLEFSLSTKKKKKSLSHSQTGTKYHKYSKDISTDENMHRNGFSNTSFNDKKFDRSFDKWRSPVTNSPGVRSPGIRVASPVAGTGLRTRKASQLISRRHSFSVKPIDTTTHSDSNTRIPFLPTIKRALGLETIVSPRYTAKDDYSSYTSHPETASPGFVPAVRLSNHDRHPLSKVRSSSVRSPNTIKIAPPDPHKLGSPRVLEVRKKDTVTDDNRKTPDMQSVLTALKEKRRKRTAGPSEEDNFCPEVQTQKSKRRRQESQQSNASTSSLPPLPASLPDLSDYTIPRLETPSLKRAAAPEVSEWDGRGSTAKRLRQEGRYNSISSSLSSSRYLERHNRSYSPRPDWSQESTAELKRAIQREINKITQEMPSDLVTSLRLQCEGVQDQSGKENMDIPVSTTAQDPDSSLSSLQRAETVMLKPSLDNEDQSLDVSTSDTSLLNQSQNKSINMREKVTLNKSFSVRKRQMSLYSGLNKSFSKVPKSNVVACMEDYEADREAEQRRVEQMLEDIVSTEETDKSKNKGSVLSVKNSVVSTAIITPTAVSSTSKTAAATGVPNLSVNSLFVPKSASTSTTTPATAQVSTPQQAGSVITSTQSFTLPSSPLTSSTMTTTVNNILQNTSVASAPSNNLIAGLSSSTTTCAPSTTVASVSSSKDSGGFSIGNVATPVKTITSTQSDKNSTLLTNFGQQMAEPGTVGAALASAVAAAYSPKAPEGLNFGAANPSKNTSAPSHFGGVTNIAVTAVEPRLHSNIPSTAVSAGFGSVLTTPVASSVGSTGNTVVTSAFSVSTGNTTGFSFGAPNSVNQPGTSAALFGNTTQSVPAATLNSNTSTNPTFSANNFQSSTATTFGTGTATTQPKFNPVFGTPNPTSQANMFSAPVGNPPAFGSAVPTFAAPQNKPTFGSPAPEVTKATGGFNFGGGATSAVKGPVFGAANNSEVSTAAFTPASATTAPSTLSFGAPIQTTTAASTFNFGNNPTTQPTNSANFNFGTSNSTTTATSTFNFGGASNSNPQTTSSFNFGGTSNPNPQTTSSFNIGGASNPNPQTTSSFNFGGTSNPKPQTTSSFNIGGASNPNPQTTSSFNFGGTSNPKPQTASSFNFGGTSNPNPQATSSFNFGGASNSTTTASTFNFGATASTTSSFNFGTNAASTAGTAPAFGVANPQVGTASVFGGSKAQSSGTFQSGMTKSGSAPAFGDTGPSFGSGPKPSNPFGTSSSVAFSGNTAPAAPQPATGGNTVFGFGAPAQQPSGNSAGGFNFSATGAGSATTPFNFGGNTASNSFGAGGGKTASNSFGVGGVNTASNSFGVGGGNTASNSFGAGSPAPGFGQASSTPGQGMFTVGASNSATKPRTMTKAKRRGARR